MAVLQQVFGTPPLPAHKVSEQTTIIGRHDNCDVMVESPAVSRQHAQITCDNGRYFIEDLNSRNGTLVNGKQIRQRTLLNDGDQVEICTLPFTFLTQNSLTELSGSWGVKPRVISVTQTGSNAEDSARRQIVQPGDRISNEELGSDGIRESQLAAKIQVADGGGGWPVTQAAAEKLNHSLRLLHSLRGVVKRNEVISRSLEALFEVFPSGERIAIVFRDESGNGIRVGAAAARAETQEIEVCLPVVRTAMQSAEAFLYVDHFRSMLEDDGQARDLRNASVRSILVTPLVGIVGFSIGAIQVDSNNRHHPLSKDDLEKLVVLGHVISCALEHVFSTEVAIADAVAARTVSDAGRLQAQMTPPHFPDVHGYRVGHRLITAPDVAADLVDYVNLPCGRVACILIDVPGRGPEAASLMTLLSRLLIEGISESGSPGKAMVSAEDGLRLRMKSVPMVISVTILVLDPTQAKVTLAIAGHCPFLMLRNGQVSEFNTDEVAAPALGADRDAYIETELQLLDDDVLLVFSDGVRTIASSDGQILKRDGLHSMIEAAGESHRSAFDSKLGSLLAAWHGDVAVADDVAFVMIHRTGNADTVDDASHIQIDSETIDA